MTSDLLASNMYLLEEAGYVIVIDPCGDLSAYDPALVYDWIFLTHEHYDHISGADVWREHTGARVICSLPCGENLKDSKKNISRYFESYCELQTWMPYEARRTYEPFITCADVAFDGQMELQWHGRHLSLFETPGHSEGSACLLVDGVHLFAGDCLIPGHEPALRFPGGNRKLWKERTLPLLRELPPETMLYPGHLEPCVLAEFSEYLT